MQKQSQEFKYLTSLIWDKYTTTFNDTFCGAQSRIVKISTSWGEITYMLKKDCLWNFLSQASTQEPEVFKNKPDYQEVFSFWCLNFLLKASSLLLIRHNRYHNHHYSDSRLTTCGETIFRGTIIISWISALVSGICGTCIFISSPSKSAL